MTTGFFDYMQVDNQPEWFDVEQDAVKLFDRDMTAVAAASPPRDELVVLQAVNRSSVF